MIKDKVVKKGSDIRWRMYICEHRKKYTSNSMRETSTKKMLCPWHVNASCPKVNNPDSAVFINKIVDEYNYVLNTEAIAFREDKRFSEEIMDDIQFLTEHCRIGATAQRRYLEEKYSFHIFFSKNIYVTIKRFHFTARSLSNDTAQMSDWLDN